MAKTVIIGGGVSGLSAGIYTLLKGGEATVCESHTRCGGNLTGWQRGDYHIDNCIHWLTGTNPQSGTYRTWCELGALGGVKVHQEEILYSYEKGRERISLYRDLDRTEREMIDASPIDEARIRRLIEAVRILRGVQGMGGAMRNEGLSLGEKIKRAPALFRFHTLSTSALAKKFRSPLLRGFIECFIGGDFSALTLIFVFAAFTADNGGIPEGGSVAMAERMENRFLNLGGELRLGRAVTKVNVENGCAVSVSLSDGSVIPCDYLVITPDPRSVFGKILKAPMPSALKSLYANKRAYRFSSIHSAFSIDEGIIDFKGDLILEIPERFRGVLNSGSIILREFSHEPSFAPKGKNIIQAMIFLDEAASESFVALKKSHGTYRARKALICELMQEIIVERYPALKDRIAVIDSWTPATYKRYTAAEIGSYMSFIIPPMMIPPRVKNKLPSFKNIYLATQWATMPGGLPNSAAEGKKCALAIAEAESIRIKARAAGSVKV